MPCTYTIDSLFRNYDSSRFEISRFKEENTMDVIDGKNDFGERGIYTFDHNGILRFYALLLSDSNNYHFSIQYDSLGNITNKTGQTVVIWNWLREGKDSLRLFFLFYAINQTYSKVYLTVGNDSAEIAHLYKSAKSSNLYENSIDLVRSNYRNINAVYISGIKINSCTGDSTAFKDSVYFPPASK